MTDEMKPHYDFSGGVRGKHINAIKSGPVTWRTIVTDHWLSTCMDDLLALHIWFSVEPRDQDKSFYLTVNEEDHIKVQEVLQ